DADRAVSNFQWDAADFESARSTWGSGNTVTLALTKHSGGISVSCVDGHSELARLPSPHGPAANLRELGDSVDGQPLWPGQPGQIKIYVRRFSDGTASTGF